MGLAAVKEAKEAAKEVKLREARIFRRAAQMLLQPGMTWAFKVWTERAAARREALLERAVAAALEAGVRHLDTAGADEWYDEAAVGRAVRASGVGWGDLWVTTKVHPRDLLDVEGAVARSLRGASSASSASSAARTPKFFRV